jgi:hypothetical protein
MSVSLSLNLTEYEAQNFAQLIKRLARRDLGPTDLNLVTGNEVNGAEEALLKLRDALETAGFSPR